ncbi:hypothetical protein [Paenibacillus sp. FSL H8-0537]|uniref:hypothetical protein n=1 Tax=Paenibacillus sp. FSL H8-0537 TaxID=2921399 RepID=UPI003101AF34
MMKLEVKQINNLIVGNSLADVEGISMASEKQALEQFISLSKALFSAEELEAVKHYFEHDEYEMAFEGLVIELYSSGKYPEEFNFAKWKELGIAFGLDKETIFDEKFWVKFNEWGQAHRNDVNIIAFLEAIHLENDNEDDQLIGTINLLLAKMDLDEQLELHGRLSPKALSNIYNARDKVEMHPQVKEHIVFAFFGGKIVEQGQIAKPLFNEMLYEYKANGFISLESILITAMKKDSLSLAQVMELEQFLSGSAFLKEAEAFKCRGKVRSGEKLDADQVVNLLHLRAYHALDFALDHGAISENGLKALEEPTASESDRKIKLALFQKARAMS